MTQTDLRRQSDATAALRADDRPRLPRRLGPWTPVELAAEGDLFRVYRARPADRPPSCQADYAVKVLRGDRQSDPRASWLLAREAAVGRSVRHPHLVSILQARLSRRPRLVVMPWLSGRTLRERLATGWQADLPVTLSIARQVALALQAMHAGGWMHGDVKPSNVFVSPQGHVTLLDLGFARRSDETGSAVDRWVTGTCSYMAPEWITSTLRADVRSDVYSLGVLLFEQLSGRLPFAGGDLAELATQHLRSRPPDLRRLAPELPGEVVRLVHQMLAKDPLRRPQTPGELVDRLAKLEIGSFSERSFG